MIDMDQLIAKIDESGLKRRYIAENLGMSESLLSKKLAKEAEFKGSEIAKLANLLRLSDDERVSIFMPK
jgi:transcriptional regulator with XRE-family HTH domain